MKSSCLELIELLGLKTLGNAFLTAAVLFVLVGLIRDSREMERI
jgi:hypothetical protein